MRQWSRRFRGHVRLNLEAGHAAGVDLTAEDECQSEWCAKSPSSHSVGDDTTLLWLSTAARRRRALTWLAWRPTRATSPMLPRPLQLLHHHFKEHIPLSAKPSPTSHCCEHVGRASSSSASVTATLNAMRKVLSPPPPPSTLFSFAKVDSSCRHGEWLRRLGPSRPWCTQGEPGRRTLHRHRPVAPIHSVSTGGDSVHLTTGK
jgi:hypothetical protein